MVVVVEKSLSVSMNARIIGSGTESMILAHGYGGDQSLWEKIIPYLTNHFRVIVFDWPFSGAVKDDQNLFDHENYSHNSYDAFANDLISLLDEIKVSSSSIFIGHSMSAMIGCIASVKRPHLFKRLILVGASPRYMNTDNYEGGFKKSEIENIIETIRTNFYDWAPKFASLVVDANDPLSVDKFAQSLRRMKPEIALSVAKTVFYSDERDVLEKVVTPCTIVQTSSDIVAPNSVAYYMQDKIKGDATVEIIDTSGHFPHLTAHLQLIEVLSRVLGFQY
ncbi:strigolactone esterase D14 [Tripterygium wilfordii]|uniref:Strigolactone esterase D14 n=2 Tax=Tripterygium wilfordii TaxID=458696 RepID=A0A7J7D9J2_TRIWF|nr:strigolactone esterase D14 [Tripterygium wilfordii]